MKINKIFLLVALPALIIVLVFLLLAAKTFWKNKEVTAGLIDSCASESGGWRWKYNYQNGSNIRDEVGNVSVEGVVLEVPSKSTSYPIFYIIRDNQAFPYSAIPIITGVIPEENAKIPDLKISDVVKICGWINYDHGDSYIFINTNKDKVQVIDHTTPPSPVFLKIRDIVDLSYKAQSFVQIRGKVTKIDNGIATLSEGPDKIDINFSLGSFTKTPELKMNQYLQITGLILPNLGYLEIFPRFDADIEEISPDAPLPPLF